MKSCPRLSPLSHCPSAAAPLLVPHWGTCEISLVSLLMISGERSFPEQSLAVSVSAGPVESSSACRSWCWEGEGASWGTDSSVGLAVPRWCPWAWLRQDTKCAGNSLLPPGQGKLRSDRPSLTVGPVLAPAAASKAMARSSPEQSRERPGIPAGSSHCGLRIKPVAHFSKLEPCLLSYRKHK